MASPPPGCPTTRTTPKVDPAVKTAEKSEREDGWAPTQPKAADNTDADSDMIYTENHDQKDSSAPSPADAPPRSALEPRNKPPSQTDGLPSAPALDKTPSVSDAGAQGG